MKVATTLPVGAEVAFFATSREVGIGVIVGLGPSWYRIRRYNGEFYARNFDRVLPVGADGFPYLTDANLAAYNAEAVG